MKDRKERAVSKKKRPDSTRTRFRRNRAALVLQQARDVDAVGRATRAGHGARGVIGRAPSARSSGSGDWLRWGLFPIIVALDVGRSVIRTKLPFPGLEGLPADPTTIGRCLVLIYHLRPSSSDSLPGTGRVVGLTLCS